MPKRYSRLRKSLKEKSYLGGEGLGWDIVFSDWLTLSMSMAMIIIGDAYYERCCRWIEDIISWGCFNSLRHTLSQNATLYFYRQRLLPDNIHDLNENAKHQ